MHLIMNTTRSGYNPSQCYSTMTVGELIEFLQQYDYDTKIYTAHDNKYTFGEIRESQFEEYFENRKYVRLKDIIKITGLSKATIYRKIEKGFLPKPFHPTERTSLWRLEDIIKFMNGERND